MKHQILEVNSFQIGGSNRPQTRFSFIIDTTLSADSHNPEWSHLLDLVF